MTLDAIDNFALAVCEISAQILDNLELGTVCLPPWARSMLSTSNNLGHPVAYEILKQKVNAAVSRLKASISGKGKAIPARQESVGAMKVKVTSNLKPTNATTRAEPTAKQASHTLPRPDSSKTPLARSNAVGIPRHNTRNYNTLPTRGLSQNVINNVNRESTLTSISASNTFSDSWSSEAIPPSAHVHVSKARDKRQEASAVYRVGASNLDIGNLNNPSNDAPKAASASNLKHSRSSPTDTATWSRALSPQPHDASATTIVWERPNSNDSIPADLAPIRAT